MATNRQINGDGDIIENDQEASYLKGSCVPEWYEQRVHTEQFTEQFV